MFIELAGDFSAGGTLPLLMLAVNVEIEGRVCVVVTIGRPGLASSQGRCATDGSIVVVIDVESIMLLLFNGI